MQYDTQRFTNGCCSINFAVLRRFLPAAWVTRGVDHQPAAATAAGACFQALRRSSMWSSTPKLPVQELNPIDLVHFQTISSSGVLTKEVRMPVHGQFLFQEPSKFFFVENWSSTAGSRSLIWSCALHNTGTHVDIHPPAAPHTYTLGAPNALPRSFFSRPYIQQVDSKSILICVQPRPSSTNMQQRYADMPPFLALLLFVLVVRCAKISSTSHFLCGRAKS